MSAGRALGMVSLRMVVALVALPALPSSLAAQAGIGSNLARVALVAHVAPKASIQGVGPALETGRQGRIREASVNLRFATNTGYRLVVHGSSAGSGWRMWVRTASGEYQELIPGAAITVARGTHSPGHSERQVSYRIESEATVADLPVRYEIVVDPTI